jgi:hypothetical protein
MRGPAVVKSCPSDAPLERSASASASFATPTFQDARYLIDQELEEPSGLLQPAAGTGVGSSYHVDTLAAQFGPLLQLVLPMPDHFVPVIRQQSVDIASLAGPVCPRDEMQLDEVAHGTRDGGRARPQRRSQLSGGGRSVVSTQQQREHPGRHARHSASHHARSETFDEIAGRLLFWCRLHSLGAYTRTITFRS